MNFKLRIPGWAKHVDHEGALAFIAFHAHICNRYGNDEWYSYDGQDINTILGLSLSEHQKWFMRQWPELGKYLQFGYLSSEHVIVKMDVPATNPNYRMWEEVEIKDDRIIRVWCYLLGIMNYNLVCDDEPRAKTRFMQFNGMLENSRLFKYSRSKYD